jgi:rubrerythrin
VDTKRYRERFESNARRPLPIVAPPDLPAVVRTALALSLARFQAGETGEGRIAHEIDRVRIATVDEDYRAALKLFVREEGRHARILGEMARALGGRPLGATKSQSMFTSARRLAGVRTKLLFLLAAEVVGIGFYGALARALPPSPLRDALREIMRDEELHLDFHADFFRAETRSPLERAAFRAAFVAIVAGASAMVIAIERETLAHLGISRATLAREYARLTAEVNERVSRERRVSASRGAYGAPAPLGATPRPSLPCP